MRTNKKLITSLVVLALMLAASVFCMSVFADAEDDLELLDSAAPAVSGCDLKKEDLTMVKVDMTGFKMLVPKGSALTVESSADVFSKSEFDRNTLISENVFFYFNTNAENYCQVYAGMVALSPLEKYYGDYSKLTKEQQDELIAQQISADDTSSSGSFEKINGRTYMMISKPDVDATTGNQYVVYGLYTVIGDYKYIVQIVAINPDSNDMEVINEMLNSVKLNGLSEPVSVTEIVLIVLTVIALIAVAFAIFTLYRFDRFVKAGVAPASVFGFDLPESVADEEDTDDSDDDDSDYDEFEDDMEEENAASEETVETDHDEKIIDE